MRFVALLFVYEPFKYIRGECQSRYRGVRAIVAGAAVAAAVGVVVAATNLGRKLS